MVTTDDSRERKRASMEQIAKFRRDGQIPVGDGTFLPIMSVALPEKEVTNMPMTDGYAGNKCVKMLRDTGCSSAIVKEDLVSEENKLTAQSRSSSGLWWTWIHHTFQCD